MSHLRNVHGYKGDHPIESYERKFGLQSAACREVRKKISEAKAAFWTKRGHHWTHAKIRAEIRRLYRSGRSLIFWKDSGQVLRSGSAILRDLAGGN